MIQNDEYRIEFVVRLCGDVLMEILRSSDRCRLTKLERVGRYFNWIVGRYYPETPFLRLNLALKSRYIMFFTDWFSQKIEDETLIKLNRNKLIFII